MRYFLQFIILITSLPINSWSKFFIYPTDKIFDEKLDSEDQVLAGIENLREKYKIMGGTPVFNKSERDFLIQQGLKSIAYTYVFDGDRELFKAIKLNRDIPKIRVEFRNPLYLYSSKLSTETNVHPINYDKTKEQWGLENLGVEQEVDQSPNHSYKIKGAVGADSGTYRAKRSFPEDKKAKPIIVAILDTGIDYTHPDFLKCNLNVLDHEPSLYELPAIAKIKVEGKEAIFSYQLKDGKKDQKKLKQDVPNYFFVNKLHFKENKEVYLAQNVCRFIKDNGGHNHVKSQIYKDKKECAALKKYEQCIKNNPINQCPKTDNNGNGYPLDCSGWSVPTQGDCALDVRGDNYAFDDVGHGTHIAGIIAADQNNEFGIDGVLQNVKILPVKVLRETKDGKNSVTTTEGEDTEIPSPQEKKLPKIKTYGDIFARGLLYAIRSNVDIINMSLGWSRDVDSVLMHQLVELAIRRGILIVAAAGNDSTDHPIYPCIYPGVICVASHDSSGALSTSSDFGSSVSVSAPGHGILSTYPYSLIPIVGLNHSEHKGFEFLSGTSMAAPFVVGALGRLLNRGKDRHEAYSRIILSSRQPPTPQSKYTLSGNLDIEKSFMVNPQPNIMPTHKEAITIKWEQRKTFSPLKIELTNFWKKAKNVKISLKIEKWMQDKGIKLSEEKNSFSFDEWEGSKTLETSLKFPDDINMKSIPGEFTIDLKIETDGKYLHQFKIMCEIVVPLNSDYIDEHTQILHLDKNGQEITKGAEIRTILAQDGNPNIDYITLVQKITQAAPRNRGPNQPDNQACLGSGGIGSKKGQWTFQLIKYITKSAANPNPHYKLINSVKLPKNGIGKPLEIFRVNLDDNSETREYVIAFQLKKRKAGRGHNGQRDTRTYTALHFYDENFQPFKINFNDTSEAYASFEYDNVFSRLPANVEWINTPGTPPSIVWVGRGTIALNDLSEHSDYDRVWHSKISNNPQKYIYYTDKDKEGKKSIVKYIEAPTSYSIIRHLPPSPAQRRNGIVPILFGQRTDSNSSIPDKFFISEFKDKKIDFEKNRRQVTLSKSRNFKEVEVQQVNSLNPETPNIGSAFGHLTAMPTSYKASILLNYLDTDKDEVRSILSDKFYAINKRHTLHRLAGAFLNPLTSNAKFFSFTNYTFEYHDIGIGKKRQASITLKRFSFLPGSLFFLSTFPVVVQGTDKRLPGMLVPGKYVSTSLTTDIIIPDDSGESLKLYRPAYFRFHIDDNCSELNNIKYDSKNPTRMVYFCQDKFIRIPLDLRR